MSLFSYAYVMSGCGFSTADSFTKYNRVPASRFRSGFDSSLLCFRNGKLQDNDPRIAVQLSTVSSTEATYMEDEYFDYDIHIGDELVNRCDYHG